MAVIAYLHDGTSVYDRLLLEELVRKNTVYFLTFNRRAVFVPKEAKMIRIKEPFAFSADKEWMEGLRMYLFSVLRSLLLRLQLRRLRPSIVLGCMATKYGFYSALSGFRPLILIVWGSDVLIAPKHFFLFRFLAKYSLKKADAVILDSEVQKNAAVQLGCRANKIVRFPWFDLRNVHHDVSREKIRQRLGWLRNPIVVCARSHEPIYGVGFLIEAIPRVIEEVPESRFLIIGKGRLTERLQLRVKQLGVENFVRFIGRLSPEGVISFLNAADINVSPSMSDGTSASLLEAMTLGIPSVVTSIAGNKEWIKDGCNGLLVPTRDPHRLAKAIVLLLEDEDLRRKLGKNAIETVNAKVNWSQNSQAIRDLISTLARNAGHHNKVDLKPNRSLLVASEDSPDSCNMRGERVQPG